MSGNSLASLLAWMKDNTRMLGWGLIVALERRKTNLIVLQEYIKRFSESSYLPPIKGDVEIVAGRRMEVIHDYVMDVPVLSFENADLNDSKAMLTMAVAGGSQLTMEKESVGWKVYKVDDIDPLQGPKLHLDLLLNKVPGNVDVDGRVKLDLSESDNFRLTFAESPNEQRLGGDFFKDLFNQLPDEKRVYTLGKIERGTNDLMRPQSFELRTQANGTAARDPESSEYGDGAVLALIRMEHRLGGDFPGANYKYLIPDDQGKDYSATVLMERRMIGFKVILSVVYGLINYEEFDRVFVDNNLVKLIAISGEMNIPDVGFGYELSAEDGSRLYAHIYSDGFKYSVTGQEPFEVAFEGGRYSIRWRTMADSFCQLECDRDVETMTAKSRLEVFSEYSVEEGIGGEVSLQQLNFRVEHDMEFVPLGKSGAGAEPNYDWGSVKSVLASGIKDKLRLDIIDKVKERLEEFLVFSVPVGYYVKDIIKLNFGQAIQGDEIHAPQDVGFFGRINPTQTTFVINPMQPLMKQGGSQQFATVPVVAGVQWKVENLVEGPGNPGTISASGLYQAPPASAIKGRFTRVRVTATAPGTGYHSSALVTVLLNELSVNPLIQVCDVGATVELSAGSLGGDCLQWSIKNPVQGESGEVRPSVQPGGDHTYHHGPVVANKTYVLDEIEVKNTRTNETRSVHVLALQKAPGTTVKILSADIAQGKVQLEASVNGNLAPAEWSLPLGGPGSISQSGLYQAPQTATERYVVIFAVVDGGFLGKFEGHLILPLPLVEFPQVLARIGLTPLITDDRSHSHGR
jgi:hypothetical protein